MSRQIFLNLAVRDLPASKAFFARLGFAFNPQFTDDKAACMILSEQGFVMLLAEPFFRRFTTTARSPRDHGAVLDQSDLVDRRARPQLHRLGRRDAEPGGRDIEHLHWTDALAVVNELAGQRRRQAASFEPRWPVAKRTGRSGEIDVDRPPMAHGGRARPPALFVDRKHVSP